MEWAGVVLKVMGTVMEIFTIMVVIGNIVGTLVGTLRKSMKGKRVKNVLEMWHRANCQGSGIFSDALVASSDGVGKGLFRDNSHSDTRGGGYGEGYGYLGDGRGGWSDEDRRVAPKLGVFYYEYLE